MTGFFIVPTGTDIHSLSAAALSAALYAPGDSPVCGLPAATYDVLPVGAPVSITTTLDEVAGQVTGLTVGLPTTTTVPLTWTAPAGMVRDYEIQWSPAGAGTWTTFSDGVSTAPATTVTGLSTGTSYDFRARATNNNPTPGAWSAVVTGLTQTPMPDYYDIVLLAGQSNMSGRGVYSAGIDTTDADVYQFGGYSGAGTYRTIFAGSDPLTHPDTVALSNGVGPGMFFAKRYKELYNRKVLLVPCAFGGTSIIAGAVTWSPYGTNNTDYLNAIDQANRAITAAVAAFPGSSFKGAAMILGEGDASSGTSAAAFSEGFAALIAGLRSNITGASDTWFLIGQMMPEAIASRTNYPEIDAVHTFLGTNYSRTTKVSIGTGYDSGDALHYNAAGMRLMGTAMANAIATAIANTGEAAPGQVTGLTAGTPTVNTIPLTWTAPATGGTVRDYEIERSVTGSGVWLPVNDGLSTTPAATVNGLNGSTSYDLRARAKNYNVSPGAWSNTVTVSTATALTDAFVRMTAIAGSLIVESGNDSIGRTYTAGNGATFAADRAGTSNLKMPSGVDGDLRFTLPVATLAAARIVGLVTTQTNPVYSTGASGYKYGVISHGSGVYRMIFEGGGSSENPDVSLAHADGDIIRFQRAGGVMLCQVARAATPTLFVTIHTFVATYTGDLWAALSFNTFSEDFSVATLIGGGWTA